MSISKNDLILEKQNLLSTIDIIRNEISLLSTDLYDKETKLKEFQKMMWDNKAELDPAEMKTLRTSNDLEVFFLEQKAKKFKKFMENMNAETGIKMLSPHELRHTYGTLLRESGVDIYTIQRVMGHADISITAGIYVHNDISVLRKQLHIG